MLMVGSPGQGDQTCPVTKQVDAEGSLIHRVQRGTVALERINERVCANDALLPGPFSARHNVEMIRLQPRATDRWLRRRQLEQPT